MPKEISLKLCQLHSVAQNPKEKRRKDKLFPEIINHLPQVKFSSLGMKAWFLKGSRGEVVFSDIDKGEKMSSHSHSAQWGVVLQGEMELTINGETKTYRKGDTYFIPQGAVHRAVFKKRSKAVDFFRGSDWRPYLAEQAI